MFSMYEINGLHKIVGSYCPDEGYDLDSSFDNYIDLSFSDEDPINLVKKVADFLGCEDYEIEPTDDEPGRVDFSILENGNGMSASEWEIKKWKEGSLPLFLADYTGYVEKVEREPFNFEDMSKTNDEMYG